MNKTWTFYLVRQSLLRLPAPPPAIPYDLRSFLPSCETKFGNIVVNHAARKSSYSLCPSIPRGPSFPYPHISGHAVLAANAASSLFAGSPSLFRSCRSCSCVPASLCSTPANSLRQCTLSQITTGGWGGRRIACRYTLRRTPVKPAACCHQETLASRAVAATAEESLPCSLFTPKTPPSCFPPRCFNPANQFDHKKRKGTVVE